MKAMVTKYGGRKPVDRPDDASPGPAAEGARREACQPGQFAPDLSFDEAARRIDVLKAEIALADSF